MGILDSKSRIVDAVLTDEGRRQLASGKMNILYYSFTDGDVFYQSSSYGITEDVTNRLYFEAPSKLPFDQIVLESDDSGKLKFENHESLKIFNGTMYQINEAVTDNDVEVLGKTITYLSGSDFSSQITGILTSSIDNFSKLQLISTKERLFDDEDFYLSSNESAIKLSTNYEKKSIDINNVPDLIENVKLSNSINFNYLPPVFIDPDNNRKVFGEWPKVSANQNLNYDYVLNGKRSVNVNDQTKFLGTKLAKKIGFEKSIDFNVTKLSSRLISQIFEISKSGKVIKLDLLNVGVFLTSDPEKPKRKVIFAGKIFNDKQTGANKFVSIFTLVFE